MVDLTCIVTNNDMPEVGRAIESALEWGCQVFVSDNGTNDHSRSVVSTYNVPCVYHADNSGSAVRGYNEGIAMCSTEWFMFLDADDVLIDPRPLLVEGADWSVADLSVRYDDVTIAWKYAGYPRNREDALCFARKRLSLPVSMKGAFRTQWVRDNGLRYMEWPAGHHYSDDCLTCLEWLRCHPRIAHTKTPCVSYRYRNTRPPGQDLFHRDLTAYLDAQ